jgi:plasmid maintenance system antidote protein VapI
MRVWNWFENLVINNTGTPGEIITRDQLEQIEKTKKGLFDQIYAQLDLTSQLLESSQITTSEYLQIQTKAFGAFRQISIQAQNDKQAVSKQNGQD